MQYNENRLYNLFSLGLSMLLFTILTLVRGYNKKVIAKCDHKNSFNICTSYNLLNIFIGALTRVISLNICVYIILYVRASDH